MKSVDIDLEDERLKAISVELFDGCNRLACTYDIQTHEQRITVMMTLAIAATAMLAAYENINPQNLAAMFVRIHDAYLEKYGPGGRETGPLVPENKH